MAVKYDKRVTITIDSFLYDELMLIFPFTSFSAIVRYLAQNYLDYFKSEVEK